MAGIPVGIISAIKRGSLLDRTAMSIALVFVSMPVFWFGLVVLFLFSNDIGRFHLLPGANTYVGLTNSPVHWFTSLILPWIVLAATSAAIYSRLLRGSLIEAMGEDYIRTARAKGLTERRVIWRHGVRSAITPVVTIFGLDVGTLLGGAVITETVFEIPGIGRLNYDAILHSDFPIVQGTVILAAMFIVVANILVDISYAYLDPARPLLVSAQDRCERAAAQRRGPARFVPDRRRRRACRRRDLLHRRDRANAGDRRGVGLGQDGLVTDHARTDPQPQLARSRAGSCSRARTSSRCTTTSCARSAATTSR